MSSELTREEALAHFGVRGMHWGIRNAEKKYGATYTKPKSFSKTYAKEIAKADLNLMDRFGIHLLNRDAAKLDKRLLKEDLAVLKKNPPIAKLDSNGHPVEGTLFKKTSDFHTVLDKDSSRAFEITDRPGALLTTHEIRIENKNTSKGEHRIVYSVPDKKAKVKHSTMDVGAAFVAAIFSEAISQGGVRMSDELTREEALAHLKLPFDESKVKRSVTGKFAKVAGSGKKKLKKLDVNPFSVKSHTQDTSDGSIGERAPGGDSSRLSDNWDSHERNVSDESQWTYQPGFGPESTVREVREDHSSVIDAGRRFIKKLFG